MTARRPKPNGMSIQKLFWVNLPGILTLIVIMAGFYATVQWRLSDFDTWRKEETSEHKSVQDKLTGIKEEDAASREKVRSEFLRRQDETNKTLGELDKKLAISDTKLQQMVDSLKDISLSLARAKPGDRR